MMRQLAAPDAKQHQVCRSEGVDLEVRKPQRPWSTSLTGKGPDQGGPQPMEIDVIKGKTKDGKGKAKDGKGKSKDGKGKNDKGKKGKPGEGKGGWQARQWSNNSWQANGWQNRDGAGSWNQGHQGGGWQQPGKGKTKQGLDPSACALCEKRGHWKNECPQKGKGKVNQIEQNGPTTLSSSASTAASSVPSSASALKAQAGYSVNRVEVYECATPRSCRCTEVFDMTELDDDAGSSGFGLASAEVMVISCPDLLEYQPGGLQPEEEPRAEHDGIQIFPMDATDYDGNWTLDPEMGSRAVTRVSPWSWPSRPKAR